MDNALIKAALTDLHTRNLKRIPTTRKAYISKSIEDVNPLELSNFMLKNSIPETAYFSTDDNYPISLEWETTIPTTAAEKAAFLAKQFETNAFTCVYKPLIAAGYKRVGACSSKFSKFGKTTLYERFISEDWENLYKWFSLFFEPPTNL